MNRLAQPVAVKREFCQKLGIEYLVLKRSPAPRLPARSSTELRALRSADNRLGEKIC